MTAPGPGLGAVLLVGAGGLVGRHVRAAALAAGSRVSTLRVPWDDEEASVAALRRGLAAFLAGVTEPQPPERPERWSIVWAAGAGVVASSPDVLEAERRVFASFLAELVRACTSSGGMPATGPSGPARAPAHGVLLLVSSAGGVYAGSADSPFTEATPPHPVSPYGQVKLAMEENATRACAQAGLPLLIARLANVYGPGQRLGKPQGLISQIALSHLSGHPLPVTVGQDTIRDYVYAADVAAVLLAGLARLHSERPRQPVVKIVASGLGVSVGHLIAESRRVLRRPLRTVLVAGRGAGQVSDLRFRSTVWPELDAHLRTPLPAGLARTAQDVLARVAGGGDLDAPPVVPRTP